MANFLYHTSCEVCGSSDAKAIYDDNSTYCFSCKHSGRHHFLATRSGSFIKKRSSDIHNFTRDFSPRALDWITKYITVEQALRHNVMYNPERDQVVFTWPDTDFYQARNLDPDSKVRYFTSGSHADILPIYYSNQDDGVVVLVEDCLSAIKIASYCHDAMPLLSSSISKDKLARLSQRYEFAVVWLDHDKGQDSIKIARQANLLGLATSVVMTELDPKCYTEQELKGYLCGQ